jgi:signal peptidase II
VKRRQALVFATTLIACVGCDHATKQLAQETLGGARGVSLAAGTLHLELAHNTGAFLGLGDSLPQEVRLLLFLVLIPAALAFICVTAWRSGLTSGAPLLGLALIAGGGLGNWLDRLLHAGQVTDFARLQVGRLSTGIFNVADVAIVAGVLILLLVHRPASRAAPGSAA